MGPAGNSDLAGVEVAAAGADGAAAAGRARRAVKAKKCQFFPLTITSTLKLAKIILWRLR